MLTTLFFLIVLHFIADFPLQGEFLANMKGKFDYLLFVHAFMWAGVISAGLVYFDLFAWWKVVMLLIGHFFIDRWKARKEDKNFALTRDLWIDQSLHLGQLLICLIK